MPTTQAGSKLNPGQLLQAIEQMPGRELDDFVDQVIALRASRFAPRLSQTESELLLEINKSFPEDLQHRFDELIAKRREGSLTETEHKELLGLVEQTEKHDAHRVSALADLARARGVGLDQVMKDLGLKPPSHA